MTTKRMAWALCAFFGCFVAATGASAAQGGNEGASADWPQWRGPGRDGIAPNSPKVLDTWPANGPPLLWESDPIGSYTKGGCGSVVVAGGKVFVFVHAPRPKDKATKVVLTAQDLADLGWRDDLPGDLARKIEDARLAEKVKYVNSKNQNKVRFLEGEELDAYTKKFIASLEAELAEKYGAYIEMRLKKGYDSGVDWGSLAKLAAIRDREFPSVEALDEAAGAGLFDWHDPFPARGKVRDMLCARALENPDTIICLDAETGKESWRKEFPGVMPDPGWRKVGASSTPAVVDGKCFVAGSAGVYCLAVKDGAVVWKAPMSKMFGGSSPLCVGNRLYQNTSDGMIALNAQTGELLWKQPQVKCYSASVALWLHEGTNYLLSGSDHLVCVEPEKGAVLWSLGEAHDSTPVVVNDTAIVYEHNGLRAYTLTLQQATEQWRAKVKIGSDAASPVIAQDCVYVCGGGEMGPDGIWCIGLSTGELRWMRAIGPNGAYATSPVLVDGKIISFFQCFDRDVTPPSRIVMFRASPEKFEELGSIARPGDKWYCDFSSPAVANGRLYVRLANSIACYDMRARTK